MPSSEWQPSKPNKRIQDKIKKLERFYMNKEFRRDYAVYCCPHVFKKQRPILLVIRDPDSDWQFLCGKDDDTDECHTVGIGHLLDHDLRLAKLADLEKGTGAERDTIESDWEYFELEG